MAVHARTNHQWLCMPGRPINDCAYLCLRIVVSPLNRRRFEFCLISQLEIDSSLIDHLTDHLHYGLTMVVLDF